MRLCQRNFFSIFLPCAYSSSNVYRYIGLAISHNRLSVILVQLLQMWFEIDTWQPTGFIVHFSCKSQPYMALNIIYMTSIRDTWCSWQQTLKEERFSKLFLAPVSSVDLRVFPKDDCNILTNHYVTNDIYRTCLDIYPLQR